MLDKKPNKARAVTTSPPRLEIIHVPIFGTIPAGIPELIEQQPNGYVAVDRLAIGVSKDAPPLRHSCARGFHDRGQHPGR